MHYPSYCLIHITNANILAVPFMRHNKPSFVNLTEPTEECAHAY